MEDEGEEEEEDSGESCVLCVVESRVSFRCCAIKKKKKENKGSVSCFGCRLVHNQRCQRVHEIPWGTGVC